MTDMPYFLDTDYLTHVLKDALHQASPTGMTDGMATLIEQELLKLGLSSSRTLRGAVKAVIPGGQSELPALAFSAHMDTLGAMVRQVKENGRLAVAPIGTWSARFAEGARVSVIKEDGGAIRGTILPLRASGHRYSKEVDTQPSDWDNLEVRLDVDSEQSQTTLALGIEVGDFVCVDPQPEFNGEYINSRFLDNKAAIASLLTSVKALMDHQLTPKRDIHLYFTNSEEVGTGAGHIVANNVGDLVAIDLAVMGPGQSSHPKGVTLAMMDLSGPYNRHLIRDLESVCNAKDIAYSKDIFRYYYSDTHSATIAGADCRMALICYACDSSHGWERTHQQSLLSVSQLAFYMMQR
ncbi:osmoprotectant NAGGN system M42 family peptidase [Celerinatantimonas diazotrophica]|uniref:Peptidase M42 family hydrolase n=1 Tax=Celerinatantimonas diazotrophica TaxID=412034 RepID=A0A4R1K1U6_9GAMM|nr:osmoprotectant NAGGN system M42 family peptidase [Celerinatantimonas diazotrophica]TCK57777.1 peptidase M42 family hydrolase [Celerinatantimonas diazotrophica]CAG9298159.1 hypothetical protein CEDIAZO_03354 [Celerinatantimonas diazotrophica]